MAGTRRTRAALDTLFADNPSGLIDEVDLRDFLWSIMASVGILVEVKTDAGDPTGVEGLLYFNTYSKRFRGYIDGAWRDFGAWT